jgi:hypothetical protein
VVLLNARVVGVDQYTEPDPAGGMREVEEVSLAITRIEMTDVASQTSVIDDVVRNY